MDEEDKINASTQSEDDKSGISSDLIRGHINTIILRALYERDKYGYEIIEDIENKSQGQYSLKQPTLYSALKRLESQGYITAYWKTDEVSQGGRRKYYKLTELGREIAEKNQAEWEYSRTVIDNLISNKSFDFTQPPPTPVDFKILKNSTSRTPVVKSENSEREVKFDDLTEDAGTILNNPTESQNSDYDSNTYDYSYSDNITHDEAPQRYSAEFEPTKNDEEVALTEEPVDNELNLEAQRIMHENYLKLISEPVSPAYAPDQVPNADEIDTERLIYINKPDTERDYRNLINNIFDKTIKQPFESVPEQPKDYYSPEAIQAPIENKNSDDQSFVVRYEESNSDNQSSDVSAAKNEIEVSGTRKKRYNLGATLFKCSLIVGVIMLLEFTLTLIFRLDLGVTYAYPFVILAIDIAQALIFGVLCATGVGKNSRKPSTLTYLTASIIVTVIIVLIICLISILFNTNFASIGDIMAKIIIPCLIALNIPIFSSIFCLFSKK